MPRPILSISVQADLRSTMEILKKENANKKMNKHIQIRLKFVQHLLGKVVLLDFVKSEKNIADLLTKGLSRSVVLESSREMGVKPIVEFTDSGNSTYLIRN